MTSSTGAELYEQPLQALPPAATGPVVAPLPPAAAPLAASPAAPTAPRAALGPQLHRREVWLPLPEEYPGFRIKLWLNYPRKWDDEMNGAVGYPPAPEGDDVTPEAYQAWSEGKAAYIFAAWGRVVLEHNGWMDFDGNPFPPPQDLNFWLTIPTELAAVIVAVQKDAKTALPNSVPTRKRR